MKYINKSILFLLVTSLLGLVSCSTQETNQNTNERKHASIYQDILKMEHALLSSEIQDIITYSKELDNRLIDNYNLFCPEETAQIDGARMINHILVQQIDEGNLEKSLDDLRMLKAAILNLQSDDDLDPYLAFLWRFEEEMHLTTKVAMDEMLNLYEWNEFEDMVGCMQTAWSPVLLHHPSPEILENDHLRYKNQTVYKIYLETAVEYFFQAVETADYERFLLCDSAEEVRMAYKDYIFSFFSYPMKDDSFLATL